MSDLSKIHNRKSICLKDYDYACEGAYFVTICTHDKRCLFGDVIDDEMQLNEAGRVVRNEWLITPQKRPNILLDEFIIMPNHIHGIIIINRRGVLKYAPATKRGLIYAPDLKERRVIKNASILSDKGVYQYAPTDKLTSPSQTLGAIVRGFKAATATRIKIMPDNSINKLWQRSFYDHIIRNEKELHQIRKYIHENPLKWQIDKEYIGNNRNIKCCQVRGPDGT